MPENIYMPKLGMTMTEGKVLRWMGTEGGKVEWECPVVSIETDKVTYEVDAPASGFLHISVPEGEKCSVGEILGMVAESREEYEEIVIQKDKSPTRLPSERGICSPVEKALTAKRSKEIRVKISPRARKLAQVRGIDLEGLQGTGPGGRIVQEDVLRAFETKKGSFVRPASDIKITPIAQAMAEDKGVDITQIRGTGPDGRIEKKDVLQAISQITRTEAPPETPFCLGSSFPLTRMREIIADRLTACSRDIPHIYLSTQVDATQMISLRDTFLEEVEEFAGGRLSLTDIVILALARNVEAHPIFNATLEGKVVKIQPEINIGLAVALDEGLIVPVIRQANRKSLKEIARDRIHLVEKARTKKLTQDEITGGTITLSNLGGFDIDFFTSIINPPETAILSMAEVDKRPVVVDDRISIRPVFNLGLAVDHRVVDGAQAASFLQDLRKLLINPYMLFRD